MAFIRPSVSLAPSRVVSLLPTLLIPVLWLVLVAFLTVSRAGFVAVADSSGNSFASDTLNAPTGVSATGRSSVTVNWTATSDTYASGHRVLRATAPGGPYTQIAQITPRTATSYVDSPAAGTYYYVVRAFHGTWESSSSNEATVTVHDVGLIGSWQTGVTHTKPSGPDRALVFLAGNEQQAGSTPTVSSVSYGGQPLTHVTRRQVTSGSKTALVEMWILKESGVAAASGTTINVTWSSAPDTALYSHAFFENVDQVTPTGASANAVATGDTPNPVPIGSVATTNLDMVIAAAGAGEVGYYTPQNGFAVGTNESTSTGGTSALGTAYKLAVGSPETASMLFVPASPPFINRQVVIAVVLNVAD